MTLMKNGGAEVSRIPETMGGEGAASASSAEMDSVLEPHVHLRAADESRFPMCQFIANSTLPSVRGQLFHASAPRFAPQTVVTHAWHHRAKVPVRGSLHGG
jgi:hypothetical protein